MGFLIAASWSASVHRQVPSPSPANRPDTAFSSARAVAQLVDVARAPRPTGSLENARVRDLLTERLERLGLETESAPAGASVHVGDAGVDVAAPANVVARLRGTASTGSILVVAHYDTGPLSPAAGAGGAALAVVLESLRAVTAGPQLRNDVLVLFADADALGGMGVERFVASHPAAADVAFFLAPALRGVSGPSWSVPVTPEGDPGAPFAGALSRPAAVPTAFAGGATEAITGPLGALVERGATGWLLIGSGGRAWGGSPRDTPELVSERTIAHQGGQLVELLRAAGAHDFREPTVAPGGAAFTTVRGADVVSWPASRMPWISLLLWLVWGALVFGLHLKGTHPRRLLPGVVLGTVTVAVGFALAGPLTEAVFAAHPEYGHVDGTIYREGPLTLALLAAVVGATVVLYGLARLRFGRGVLYLGALSVPLVVLAWATFAAPGIAAWLQPALAMALVWASVVALVLRDRPGGTWAWLATVVVSGLFLFLTVPGMEGLAATLTPASGATLGAAFAGVMLLLLPLGDWLLLPRRWLTPAVAFAGAAGLAAMILPSVQGPVRHPEPTSLVLLVDDAVTPSMAAMPSGGALEGDADSLRATAPVTPLRKRRIAGTWLTVEGAGESWARSWAVPGDVGPRGPEGLLLPRPDDWIVSGAGAAADLALPAVELLGTDEVPGGWTARIAVRPGLGGEIVGLRLPDGSPGRIRSVDGVSLASAAGDGPVRSVRRWGSPAGPPPVFELHFPADAGAVSFDVIEHHLRPAELLGREFFVRNQTVFADASTGSDRVIQRSAVRLERPPPP